MAMAMGEKLPTAELVTRDSLWEEGREQPREGSENDLMEKKEQRLEGHVEEIKCFISLIAFILKQEEIFLMHFYYFIESVKL